MGGKNAFEFHEDHHEAGELLGARAPAALTSRCGFSKRASSSDLSLEAEDKQTQLFFSSQKRSGEQRSGLADDTIIGPAGE